MQGNEYTLPNGPCTIHEPTLSKAAYCGPATDAGTRGEAENEQGMAHFVEHLIFEGTERWKVWHIFNRMENVGGDLNAYTNKEEIVVYVVFLKEHLECALELLGDIVSHSTSLQHEIEKETKVTIDETQSYEGTPSELMLDDFEDMILRNHPLGRNILGKPEFLWSFCMEDVLSLTCRSHQLGNMVLFVRGQHEFKRIIRLVEKYLLDIPDVKVENRRIPPPLYAPEHSTVARDVHQAHAMIGSCGYNAYNDKCTVLYLLNNVLGGPGMNSKLNMFSRERRGLVYNVESNLTSHTGTGAFRIYFGTDMDDMGTCLKLTYKELKRMRDTKMTTSQLAVAKRQLIEQIGVAPDNFENNTLGTAKTFLHCHRYEPSEFVFKRIEELIAEMLLEVANEMFAGEYLSTLIYK